MSDTQSDDHDHGHDHDDGAVHAHVSPVKLYVNIFLALLACTALTYGVASIHLGALNLAVAVVIATIKAALVVTFFMHLKDDARFNALVFVGALLFAGAFLTYTLNDTTHRSELEDVQGGYVDPASGEVAPGGIPGAGPLRADYGESEEEQGEHDEAAEAAHGPAGEHAPAHAE